VRSKVSVRLAGNTSNNILMRIVFACAGEQTRWRNYLNCPKHLVPVQGNPLLKRNIELFARVFNCGQFHVSIRSEELKNTYSLADNICFYVANNIEAGEPWVKTLLPFLRATEEDVLVLLGDVIFSENCVSAMLHNVTKNVFNIYGRKYKSSITGGKWGELFALYIPQHFKESFLNAVNAVEQLYTTKEINRFSGWEVISYIYSNKSLEDLERVFNNRLYPDNFIEVDDETEDFDYPEDYDNYLNLLKND